MKLNHQKKVIVSGLLILSLVISLFYGVTPDTEKATAESNLHSPVVNTDGSVTFNYKSNGESVVYLVGSFPDISWDPSKAIEMVESNGIFSTTVSGLQAGTYEYKFILNQRTWDQSTTDPLNPNMSGGNSVLVIQASGEVVPKTKVIIHYQEAPGNTTDWSLWVWPFNEGGKRYTFSGSDAFGKIAEIELDGDHDRVGFIVSTEDWQKDIGEDRYIELVESNIAEVWLKSGDPNVYTTPPDGEYRTLPVFETINIKIHYYRFDTNYTNWDVWVWPKGGDGQAVSFSEEDAYGKVATVTLNNANVRDIGFIVRKNDWSEKDINADRYITRLDANGNGGDLANARKAENLL